MAERSTTSDARLGRGWALPVRLAPDGGIALVAGEQTVAQSIWTILATAPGERVGQPDFGCGIHDLVFAPSDGGTAAAVTELVRTALRVWEPRIDLTDVRVEARPAEARLLIRIDYRLRSAPGAFNLVFPFYLEGAPGP
jgi:phage baseplate assembly protein W